MSDLMKIADNAVQILDDNKGTILMVGGIVSGIAGTVFACKATLSAQDILADFKSNKNEIKKVEDEYPEYKGSATNIKHHSINYASTGANLAKIYAPAVVLGATSIACIVGEHCIMQSKVNNLEKTVASLSAAYIAVDTAFKKYRKRVVDKYGEEVDRRLRYGIEEETVETTNEKGKKVKEKKEVIKDWNPDDFSKIFDGTPGSGYGFTWWRDPNRYHIDWDATIRQLKCAESAMNEELRRKGYLWLNEAYNMISIDETVAGQTIGWIYDPEVEHKIDLGLNNPMIRRIAATGEEEDCILLTFNVDGDIHNRISIAAK